MDDALRLEPDNAQSHTNKGWTLIESGDPSGALKHFREALRLDHSIVWARQGLVTALKAQNPMYRVMQGYFLWIESLPRAVRWSIIIWLWGAVLLNGAVRRTHPALAPFCLVLSALCILFCCATWTAEPLFNMLVRFNRFGRYVLNEYQIAQSNWMAGALLVSLLAFLTYFVRPRDGYLVLFVGSFFVLVCAASVFRSSSLLNLRGCSVSMWTVSALVAGMAIFVGL